MGFQVGRAYRRSDEWENKPAGRAKRAGVANGVAIINDMERRWERPSVNESSINAAPQRSSARTTQAVGKPVRGSIIVLSGSLEFREQDKTRNASPNVDRGVTRSLQPTCYPCVYSTVTEDGKLFDRSQPQGEARTRLNSAFFG